MSSKHTLKPTWWNSAWLQRFHFKNSRKSWRKNLVNFSQDSPDLMLVTFMMTNDKKQQQLYKKHSLRSRWQNVTKTAKTQNIKKGDFSSPFKMTSFEFFLLRCGCSIICWWHVWWWKKGNTEHSEWNKRTITNKQKTRTQKKKLTYKGHSNIGTKEREYLVISHLSVSLSVCLTVSSIDTHTYTHTQSQSGTHDDDRNWTKTFFIATIISVLALQQWCKKLVDIFFFFFCFPCIFSKYKIIKSTVLFFKK